MTSDTMEQLVLTTMMIMMMVTMMVTRMVTMMVTMMVIMMMLHDDICPLTVVVLTVTIFGYYDACFDFSLDDNRVA